MAKIKINGTTFKSYSAAAQACGIKYANIRKVMQAHQCSFEEAVMHTVRLANKNIPHTLTAYKGASAHPLYNTWKNMFYRCYDSKCKSFKYYGGRYGGGIEVDPKWADFTAFITDMGTRPAGCSLDREDNFGHYTPTNCRWATASEQARNRRPLAKLEMELLIRDQEIARLGGTISRVTAKLQ